jgi:hypothetical protein
MKTGGAGMTGVIIELEMISRAELNRITGK